MAENHEKQGFTFFAFLPPYIGVSDSLVSRNGQISMRSIDWYQKFLISRLAARYSTVFVFSWRISMKIYRKSGEDLAKNSQNGGSQACSPQVIKICIFTGYLACRVDLARRGYLGRVCTGRSMHTWVKVPENPDPGIPHMRGGMVLVVLGLVRRVPGTALKIIN